MHEEGADTTTTAPEAVIHEELRPRKRNDSCAREPVRFRAQAHMTNTAAPGEEGREEVGKGGFRRGFLRTDEGRPEPSEERLGTLLLHDAHDHVEDALVRACVQGHVCASHGYPIASEGGGAAQGEER